MDFGGCDPSGRGGARPNATIPARRLASTASCYASPLRAYIARGRAVTSRGVADLAASKNSTAAAIAQRDHRI